MKKVIILLGPTGVGKTAASVLLAQLLDTEILGSDSMQIYRYMDIGTAKPSPDEQRAVRHHMIDVVDPWETYSTGRYIEDAAPVIDRLHSEGRLPVVVGGTGLYIKAMTRGIFSGPSADWDLRNRLLDQEAAEPGSLYLRLQSEDPEAASRIMPTDTRRVVRALEVCLNSGDAMSKMQSDHTKQLPYDFIKIGLTRDRAELYRLIDQRVDAMMQAGLLDEVRAVTGLIRQHGSAGPAAFNELDRLLSFPSMQAIGYKELAMSLYGQIGREDAVNLVKQRSRNYAKRQFTWFKKEEGIRWIDITGVFDSEEIFQRVRKEL